jgi:hypothetical protein
MSRFTSTCTYPVQVFDRLCLQFFHDARVYYVYGKNALELPSKNRCNYVESYMSVNTHHYLRYK